MLQFVFFYQFLELFYPRFESERERVHFQQLLHHLCSRAKVELIKCLSQLMGNKNFSRQLFSPQTFLVQQLQALT